LFPQIETTLRVTAGGFAGQMVAERALLEDNIDQQAMVWLSLVLSGS